MSKVTFKPGTMLNPLPVVMVSCGSMEAPNIVTIAWTGIINSEPPITYVSIRKSRYSHELISQSGEFVINLTTEKLAETTDFCGVRSGRELNKFQECGLTPIPSDQIGAPMILESPVNLECRVMEVKSFPSHDMFIAEILAVHADESLLSDTGKLRLDKAGLLCYNHGEYYGIHQRPLGRFGYSIMKPKTKKKLEGKKRSAMRTKKGKTGGR